MNDLISIESITSRIYFIRGKKVMIDRDLAELYEVETKRLKEQVRRNISRFPEDFMFVLINQEVGNLKCLSIAVSYRIPTIFHFSIFTLKRLW